MVIGPVDCGQVHVCPGQYGCDYIGGHPQTCTACQLRAAARWMTWRSSTVRPPGPGVSSTGRSRTRCPVIPRSLWMTVENSCGRWDGCGCC